MAVAYTALAGGLKIIIKVKYSWNLSLAFWLAGGLLLLLIIAAILRLQSRRLPLTWLVDSSWQLAAVNEARASKDTRRLRELGAGSRRRPRSGSSPVLYSNRAWILLQRLFLLRWRSGWWGLTKGYLLNTWLLFGTLTVVAISPQSLPLLLLMIFLRFSRQAREQFETELYHEEFLFTLPFSGQQVIAAQTVVTALPLAIASLLAGLLFLTAVPFSPGQADLITPLVLTGPGLLLALVLAQNYEQLLEITGSAPRFLPEGITALLITGLVWANAAWLISYLSNLGLNPWLIGILVLAACLGISGVLLAQAGYLFNLGPNS